LRSEDPRLVLIRQEPRGLAAALNDGIARARAEYVARQDADDVSLPDRFARQIAYLDAHPSVAAVGTATDVIDAAGSRIGALGGPSGVAAVRQGLLSLRATPVHGSMMLRRSAVTALGGYRDAFGAAQDYDLWLRLIERFDIDNLPAVLYKWRLDSDGVYAQHRERQLRYAGIALAFARERERTGADSYQLLADSGSDLDGFAARYRFAPYLHALWGELLLRGLGNSARVREHLRRAVLGGYAAPWTLCLFGWTHLGLPWPGGRPLARPAAI
jgi:glycosyltransferase involved in cell wall biosynthesis